ncbi:PQQ-binding-like beta-propeller repeat protein [Streptomyces sp. NPDC049627]|uniref:outer membrane protein assembly factor BamB family protein n=1 Tax=Streptomyces sp. NPDC049627 TaxID=3365595 RepID=UPI00379648FC
MAERTNSDRRYGTAAPSTLRTVLGGLTAIGILLAIVVGVAWTFLSNTGYWPGSSMTTAWETQSDNQAPGDSIHQAWLVDDTLVRARYDAVTGFDAGSGKKRWEFVPPRRTDICATSITADGTRVLIAYDENVRNAEEGCATVAALDLADGSELWHTALAANGDTADRVGALAVGSGLGVLLDAGTGKGAPVLRAVDLRTGSPRWTAAVPKGCVPGRMATAPKQVLAVLACGEEMKLAVFDPADGRERWTTPLDTRNGVPTDASVTITATEPIVLRVDGGDRGIDAFLTFGPDGRPGARVQATGDSYGSIGTDVVVSDRRLFALTDGGKWGLLAAFDPTTGDELWQEDIGGAGYVIKGLHAEAGRVMAVKGSAKYGDVLYVFDAATGNEEEDRAFRDGTGSVDDLLPYKDLIIAVRSGSYNKPFTAYERW